MAESSAPQKFSRYRSVRRAQEEQQSQPSQQHTVNDPTQNTASSAISRSMSRYHRPSTSSATSTAPPLPLQSAPPIPTLPTKDQDYPAQPNVSTHPEEAGRFDDQFYQDAKADTAYQPADRLDRAHHSRLNEEDTAARTRTTTDRNTHRLQKQQLPSREQSADEQKEGRQQQQSTGSAKRTGLFSRFRGNGSTDDKKLESAVPTQPSPPQPGLARIPAPAPLFKADDRRVLVQCGKSSIALPVSATTTPYDLLKSAANCLAEPIDPEHTLLEELFGKVGVLRPLRKYERVRDTLNSWDNDEQHPLTVIPIDSLRLEHRLAAASATSVSADKPVELAWWLYHSQKPGRWAKRYITLRPDGQVTLARADNIVNPKDIASLCHLTDFDIYLPTRRQHEKKIKPPKKCCYAIKSQQKSTMFLETTNFVHFFCTNDRRIADSFYSAIQGWRSWYLVHVLGEGQKSGRKSSSKNQYGQFETMDGAQSRHLQVSNFKPLLDLDKSVMHNETGHRERPVSQGRDTATATQQRSLSVRKRSHPPLSNSALYIYGQDRDQSTIARPRPTANEGSPASQRSQQPDQGLSFSANGLLGRTYSQRRRQLEEREAGANTALTNGPSLLNSLDKNTGIETAYVARTSLEQNSGLRRSSSVRSNHRQPITQNSSGSQPGQFNVPKPLVDLTPRFQEPPQHTRKGRGHRPEQGYTGALIDSATSPTEAVHVPPSTDWRRRDNTSSASPNLPAGTPLPSHFLHHNVRRNPAAIDDDAFTGRGLLAKAAPSQGGSRTGHGVMSGNNASGPMLDVSAESQFAPGSLLRKVEQERGPSGPIIDREKRKSFEMKVGEGY